MLVLTAHGHRQQHCSYGLPHAIQRFEVHVRAQLFQEKCVELRSRRWKESESVRYQVLQAAKQSHTVHNARCIFQGIPEYNTGKCSYCESPRQQRQCSLLGTKNTKYYEYFSFVNALLYELNYSTTKLMLCGRKHLFKTLFQNGEKCPWLSSLIKHNFHDLFKMQIKMYRPTHLSRSYPSQGWGWGSWIQLYYS